MGGLAQHTVGPPNLHGSGVRTRPRWCSGGPSEGPPAAESHNGRCFCRRYSGAPNGLLPLAPLGPAHTPAPPTARPHPAGPPSLARAPGSVQSLCPAKAVGRPVSSAHSTVPPTGQFFSLPLAGRLPGLSRWLQLSGLHRLVLQLPLYLCYIAPGVARAGLLA